MTNRNLLLGRSKPSEKLSREEIVALDRVTAPPALPAKPPKPESTEGGPWGQPLKQPESAPLNLG